MVFAGALLALLYTHSKFRQAPDRNFGSAGFLALNLPFTIPCATTSDDAAPVYLALRTRDRRALKQLFSERRMLAVQKGSPVRMSRFGRVVGVKVEGGVHAGTICFVPPDVVPVIHNHAGR